MKTFTFSALCFLLLWGISCQQSSVTLPDWPEITQETKPWSRWWWQGSIVTKAGITAELEAYQKAGLGGLELTPIYGVIGEEEHFIEYLSPEWMDMLEFTLQEAKRLGLGLDMATGTGWPFGGPWVNENDASKYMVHKTYSLKAGEKLNEPVTYLQQGFVRAVPNQVYQLYGIYKEKGEQLTGSQEQPELLPDVKPLQIEDLIEPVAQNENLQALALDQVRFNKPLLLQSLTGYSDQGEILDLLDKVNETGHLNWSPETGSWKLYAVFQGWHGKMVERAAPGGEGNVIDHFSTAAIQHYLTRFDSAFSGRDISGLRAFFNDSYEVDDARGQANWTPKLLEEFQQRRGYDLQEHWPALFGEENEEMNTRVLSDFRETVSDLLLETFTREWGTWARSKGAIIRNQAHGSPANILDLYAASDIPETEGTDLIRIKFATSAAHVAGRKLASSESATWLNEHFLSNLADLKENIDRYLVGGVNHVLYHGTCYSPPEEAWPGRLFYAAVHANPRNSLWRDFAALNQYIARTQSFLQKGSPDNDILLYFPAYDRFATPRREILDHFDGHGPSLEGTAFESNAEFLLNEGYAFDYISDRQILQLNTENNQLLSKGNTYRAIVVPECQFMPLPTLKKLLALAEGGATLIFHKSLPAGVPGLGNLDQRQDQFQSLVGQLSFQEKAGGATVAQKGGGIVLMGGELDQLLDQAGVHEESLVGQGLAYTRRKDEGGKCYFISNWSEKEVNGWIALQTKARAVVIFDPMTGSKGLAKLRSAEGGKCEVYLQLARGSSCILRTFSSELEDTPWNYFLPSGDASVLSGTWKLDFLEGGPEMPEAGESDTPGSWTDLDGDAYKKFSGTARYSLSFTKPEGNSPAWLLDLGQVHESARIRLNEQDMGTLIGPVYQLMIESDLLTDTNTLDIEVSNLMANRIADLDRRGVLWKKFYNINFPPRRRENRGRNGLFDASEWEPLPSGLIGPVTLSRMEIME